MDGDAERAPVGSVWAEVRRLLVLGIPAAATQLALMLMGVVDTAMLGHFDDAALAAAGVGNMWSWSFTALGFGLVFVVESMVSQAYGRGDHEAMALALQRGLVMTAVAAVPITVIQFVAEPALLLLGQPPTVAAQAGLYCAIRSPAVAGFLAFTALRVFLQGRNLVWPPLAVAVVVNVLNVLFNWALIWGNLGVPRLGLAGAALATALSSLALPVGLWVWMWRAGLFAGYTRAWDGQSWSRAGLLEVARLGAPVGIQTALEGWAFGLSMIIAGWLGVLPLAAHQIILNVAALVFMVPLGLSIGAATRVGNLLGAADLPGARQAARLALLVGASWGLCSGAALIVAGPAIPRLFTASDEVRQMVLVSLPWVAAFQLFDATQALASGLLRSMGRPRAAAFANLISYFVVALPMAYVLGVRGGGGLPAIWACMAIGLALVALSLSAWVLVLSGRSLEELTISVTRE